MRRSWPIAAFVLIFTLVFTTVTYSFADLGSNTNVSSISPGAVSNEESASPPGIEEETEDATPQPAEPGEATDGAIDAAGTGSAIDAESTDSAIDDGSTDSAIEPGDLAGADAREGLDNFTDKTSKGGITLQATTEYFISIPQLDGTYSISGTVASASTTDSTRATFSGGRIVGHTQGVATVTLNMENGDVRNYHVSVYYKYPQPKTSVVFASGDGKKLTRWGKVGNSDDVSPERELVAGELITILWRAHDQNDTGNHVYQYVRTGDGKEGYVDDAWHSDRPMGGYFAGTFGGGYYNDVAVGENSYISSESGDVIKEDSKSWSSSDTSVLTVTMKADGSGHANQGFIEGKKEGSAIATTVLEYDSKNYRSSEEITVYTKWASVSGRVVSATYVRNGAYSGPTAIGNLSTGATVTISGESGNYYRIGQARYVLKSAVTIPVTDVSVTPSYSDMTAKEASQLSVAITPSAATNKTIAWTSGNTAVATVSSSGKVTGVKEGVSVISAKSSDGNVTDTSKATVYSQISNVAGRTIKDASIGHNGDGSSSAGSLSKGAAVTISGKCGDYWRIGESRYIKMADVYIPATSVKFNRAPVLLYKSGSTTGSDALTITAIITPSIATGKVSWASSNKNVAAVSTSGKVTAAAKGATTISAVLDGKRATCAVTVHVPTKTISIQKLLTLKTSASATLKANHNPADAYGHTYTFTASNKKPLSVDGKGVIKSTPKEGTSNVYLAVSHKKPSVGVHAATVSAKTFVSVYASKALTVRTNAKDVMRRLAATTSTLDGVNTAQKIQNKGTILQVLGSCGNFYYVKMKSAPAVKGFVLKSKVENITLLHKNTEKGKSFTPLDGDKVIVKTPAGNMLTGGTAVFEKSGKKYTGRVTVTGPGTSKLKAKNGSENYEMHITGYNIYPTSVGHLVKDANTYSCWASPACYHDSLLIGNRVTMTGNIPGKAFKVAYKKNGKTRSGYVASSAVGYIKMEPYVLKSGGASVSQNVTSVHVKTTAAKATLKKDLYASATIIANTNGIKVTPKKVDPTKDTGYHVMTIKSLDEAGQGYSTHVPVSVYKAVSARSAYISGTTKLYDGASMDSPSQATKSLSVGAQVTIKGETKRFFYVSMNKGKEAGFVEKSKVAYIQVSPAYVSVDKAKKSGYPKVIVRVYNDSKTTVKMSNSKLASFSLDKKSDSLTIGNETYRTFSYSVAPRKVGSETVSISVKSLPASFRITVYEQVKKTKGKTAKDTTQYKAPGGEGAIITIPDGTSITILRKCKGWFYVKAGDKKGWVRASDVIYITFSAPKTSMYCYQQMSISAYLHNADNDEYKKMRVSSSPANFATVTSGDISGGKNIKIDAKKAGTLTITASYDGGIVKAKQKIKIDEVTLSLPSSKEIPLNRTNSLSAVVKGPKDAKITWSTSNSEIVSISAETKTGINITGKGYGSTTITAKYEGITKKCKVKVVSNTPAGPYQPESNGYPPPSAIERIFKWDSTQGIWYSPIDAPQYRLGYNNLWDWLFEQGGEITETHEEFNVSHVKFISYFSYPNYAGKNKDWRIEGWKGNYMNMGAGAEIGLYYKKSDSRLPHYSSVARTGGGNKKGDMQQIQFSLYKNSSASSALFAHKRQYHWWLTGFDPREVGLDEYAMRLEGLITFRDNNMAKAFRKNAETVLSIDDVDTKDPDSDIRTYINGRDVIISNWK
ncbi:MAG: Ig-like domain-containing protein [Clostridiales Family XIII bacterium]|jgi:uncharacterized protein YjdB|nr:Ig-like domain-containing protein [Clostridiales Family XIII bacterium]